MVNLYKSKDFLIIHSFSQTKDEVWIASRPFYKFKVDEKPTIIVDAISECMNSVKFNILPPKSWGKDFFLSDLGIKSNSILHKQFICCEIKLKGFDYIFTPMKNAGNKNGYIEIDEKRVAISKDASKDKIYDVLKITFNNCE